MIRLHHGNRLERLGDALAELLAQPLASPLAAETVLVQSNGMARWLSLRLAQQNRVCANVEFPYPAGFAWKLLRAFRPELTDVSSFEPDRLTWRLYGLLPTLIDDPRYAELAHYLRGGEPADRYQLARRIADVYDQYLVYRPDWMLDWQAGAGDDHWQAALWRLLCADGTPHRAQLLDELMNTLTQEQPPPGVLPERIALFGIATLPPPYVTLLEVLARHCDIHVFLLNPSAEYWGLIRSERAIGRSAADADPATLYLETGNKLLASWGRQGQDSLELLLDQATELREYFAPPEGDRLLHGLQADILQLRNRGGDGELTAIAADDDTLQIHSCHSPMREVEVLHDQLLQLFEQNPALSPADVVVMTPDIETYAAYIDAVFATDGRIPYAVADRSTRREQPLVECVVRLLELPESRLEADRVAALLETPALRRRFGIDEADLPRIHDWLRRAGIRWGVDAAHRRELGLPEIDDHSWRQGLDRILLGYAMPGREQRLFADVLPFDEVEGSGAELAGRLLAFVAAVFDSVQELGRAQPVEDWRETLNRLLERFFEPEQEDEEALAVVRLAVDQSADAAAMAGPGELLPLAVIGEDLKRRLEEPARVGGFLSGGVTFCAMVPMRSIPFKVVCLLGLNDGEFPRQQQPVGFDLIARQPRRGDRVRRFEDRYLFLEALLSARRCLYLSFIGQSLRDNSSLPPSVIVDELLDYIGEGWTAGEQSVRQRLLTQHRLQAFSPAYFDGSCPRLFSYARHLRDAGALAGRGRDQRAPVITQPLPEPDASWRDVDLAGLIEFWASPAEFLLRRRLGIRLDQRPPLPEHREPFLLDGLESWQLRQDLLALELAGTPAPPARYARAAGRLPHGVVGDQVLDEHAEQVAAFAEQLRSLPSAAFEPLPFVLELDDLRLRGVLDKLSPEGRADYRLGSSRSRHLLAVWITHLALNAVAPAAVMPVSHWLSETHHVRFAPVADAHQRLTVLLQEYWRGLHTPLPLPPNASYQWAQRVHKGRDGISAARSAWLGNDKSPGDCEDPYLALAFADSLPLDDARFVELGEAVWLPLLQAMEDA